MDNLRSHKTKPVRAAIRNAGAHPLLLPPCSPYLNLIRQAFAKLKQWMRESQARTRDTLWRNVGSVLDEFKPAECANYLRNAGYVAT